MIGPPTLAEQLAKEAYWTQVFIEKFDAKDVPDDYANIPERESDLESQYFQLVTPPPF